MIIIEGGDVTQELAQHEGVLSGNGARRWHLDGMDTEIRHPQVAQQAAVRVRIGAHPPVALWRRVRAFSPARSARAMTGTSPAR